MEFIMAASLFVAMMLYLSMGETKPYRPIHYSDYTPGMIQHHEQGKPTSRHKNHCAYVIERTVSFTVQDGAAPYVKAEYKKCSWHKKCPTLSYRLIYKPIYKVAHKTVTELEWRCCPGYSGYSCMEGPPAYQYPMKSMPPFKGPPFQYKGPMFKAPPINPLVKANPWNQPKGPPTNGYNYYPMHHFGPPRSSNYPGTSFEPYPDAPEPIPDHKEEHLIEHEQEHELKQRPEETITTPTDDQPAEGQALEGETEERIYRMEEDVRRLNQGLETVRGTVNGLEESLRASLREDANRMLSALLSAAPSTLSAPRVDSSPSTIGFVEIPGGDPDAEGLDGRHVIPDITKLNGRIEELRTELQAKTTLLQELKATVLTHDGVLKKMSIRVVSDSARLEGQHQKSTEQLLDAKLNAARTDILDGFEKHVESAEDRCEEKSEDVYRQCQKEQSERQEKMEDTLVESTINLSLELRKLQAQVQHLNTEESCCATVRELSKRVHLVETSVGGLNQSQKHLRVELGGHKDHIEGMLEGRLKYVETKLNVTGKLKSAEPGKNRSISDKAETGQGLEARMDDKLQELEGRLLTALEELGNATAPALLEGHAVPTLETELESLRGKVEMDVDRVQKHLSSLEMLCSTSCSLPRKPTAIQGDSDFVTAEDQKAMGLLERHGEHLNSLNSTLQNILTRLTDKDHPEKDKGELTILKFTVHSVNSTLKGFQDSLETVGNQVGKVNSSWHERESRLAQQMKGVVQLVGHQASMLGVGERKLTRLKGEMQEMKRRLAEEVQGCRSTAMGVQKEVTEVCGRVANVEDQCKGLNYLAEDLDKIREEFKRQSNGFLLKFNGTLSNHSHELSELRDEIKNCTTKVESAQQSLEVESESQRGDTFTLK
ncbi:EMILIN-3 [Entelurus aequoreus]|uniref:EMILIN-3 n=1 Tax=Entelurus aequoreus TaxID=161455 RepID=UPI002B1D0165|nr:EMILIN-3 [Entelurus aequoreus]